MGTQQIGCVMRGYTRILIFSIITHSELEIRRRQLDIDSVKVELKKKLHEYQHTQAQAISSPPMHVSLHYMYDLAIYIYSKACLRCRTYTYYYCHPFWTFFDDSFFLRSFFGVVLYHICIQYHLYTHIGSVVGLLHCRWLCIRNSYACLFYSYEYRCFRLHRNGF